jgi:hypothetical protein
MNSKPCRQQRFWRKALLNVGLLSLLLPIAVDGALAAPFFDNSAIRAINATANDALKIKEETASKSPIGNTLVAGQELKANDTLMSKNGEYFAYITSRGYFLVTDSSGRPVWTPSDRTAVGGRLSMQGDGNLCVYPPQGGQVWCSRSNRPGNGFFVMLRDTGVLEIYAGDPKNASPENLIWTSLLDAQYYGTKYGDLKQAYNGNAENLMYHWVTSGRYEGRSPRASIDDTVFRQTQEVNLQPKFYADKYPDLKAAFGYDPAKLYLHWIQYGFKEGRVPNQFANDFLAPAPRSANGLSEMRINDWLKNEEYMLSRNKQFLAILQSDGNLVVYRASNKAAINPNNRVWWQRNTSEPTRAYFMTLQADGHMCTYEDLEPQVNVGKDLSKHGQGLKCSPDAGGPLGSYYISLEDDGNLVIHRGTGPADNRGQLWDSNSLKPKARSAWWEDIGGGVMKGVNTVVGAANKVYQTGSDAVNWVNNASNTINTETVRAANTVAGVSVQAYTTVRDEANNLYNQALGWMRSNCHLVSKFIPGPFSGFSGAQDALKVFKDVNGALPNQLTGDALACSEAFQQGYYCQVPEEMLDVLRNLSKLPELVARVNGQANSPECQTVGESINGLRDYLKPLRSAGIPMPDWFTAFESAGKASCGVALVIGKDTVKAGQCTVAAAKAGVLERMFALGDGGSGTDVEKRCRLAGRYALKAAKTAVMKNTGGPVKSLVSLSGNAGMESQLNALPECREGSYARVTAAWYGVEDGPHLSEVKGVNVADRIRNAMRVGQIQVPAATNEFFGGDPVPGKPKVIAVQVEDGGKVINLRQDEGKALKYPGTEGVDYRVVK